MRVPPLQRLCRTCRFCISTLLALASGGSSCGKAWRKRSLYRSRQSNEGEGPATTKGWKRAQSGQDGNHKRPPRAFVPVALLTTAPMGGASPPSKLSGCRLQVDLEDQLVDLVGMETLVIPVILSLVIPVAWPRITKCWRIAATLWTPWSPAPILSPETAEPSPNPLQRQWYHPGSEALALGCRARPPLHKHSPALAVCFESDPVRIARPQNCRCPLMQSVQPTGCQQSLQALQDLADSLAQRDRGHLKPLKHWRLVPGLCESLATICAHHSSNKQIYLSLRMTSAKGLQDPARF